MLYDRKAVLKYRVINLTTMNYPLLIDNLTANDCDMLFQFSDFNSSHIIPNLKFMFLLT